MGTTKFKPLPDARNIMVTGGAGFMYAATRPAGRRALLTQSLQRVLVRPTPDVDVSRIPHLLV